jgi:hypothetical protein
VEGQWVDSWTDDLAASGGVGFFAEAGERARLYWMKVSRNQDLLGTICSFLSGGSTEETAELWGPGIPANLPQPAPWRPVEVLALAERTTSYTGGGRARVQYQRRIEKWS